MGSFLGSIGVNPWGQPLDRMLCLCPSMGVLICMGLPSAPSKLFKKYVPIWGIAQSIRNMRFSQARAKGYSINAKLGKNGSIKLFFTLRFDPSVQKLLNKVPHNALQGRFVFSLSHQQKENLPTMLSRGEHVFIPLEERLLRTLQGERPIWLKDVSCQEELPVILREQLASAIQIILKLIDHSTSQEELSAWLAEPLAWLEELPDLQKEDLSAPGGPNPWRALTPLYLTLLNKLLGSIVLFFLLSALWRPNDYLPHDELNAPRPTPPPRTSPIKITAPPAWV